MRLMQIQTSLRKSHFLCFLFVALIFSCQSLSAQITYVVNTIDDNDDGICDGLHCSLREAMFLADIDGVPSNVHFDLSTSLPAIIQPVSGMLPILWGYDTVIDASTQPGFYPGSIVIDGQGLGLPNGITIEGGFIEIYGLKISGFNNAGIALDWTGSSNGVFDVFIGDSARPNIITNNGFGIQGGTNAFGVVIDGNNIGVSETLAQESNLLTGIYVYDSYSIINNNVGPNGGDGIRVQHDNFVENNHIGIHENGLNNIDNGGNGVTVDGSNNTIRFNDIAYNNQWGIQTNCTGCIQNLISQNSMFCNFNGGINNIGNNTYPPPVITHLSRTSISGTANPNDVIEIFFTDDFCYKGCEGQYYFGSTTTDGAGNWSTSFEGMMPHLTGVIATARDASNNTSEFACFNFDECEQAFSLTMNQDECIYSWSTVSKAHAGQSSDPWGACPPGPGDGDLWFKTTAPSTGALMLHFNEMAYSTSPIVEIYDGTCGALNYIQCDSLFKEPRQASVSGLTPGSEVFFRMYNWVPSGFDPIPFGQFELAVRELPTNPDDWTICTGFEFDENYVANEFVVQFEIDATQAEIDATTNSIIAEGGNLLGECSCSNRTLQLWGETNPIETEERIGTTRDKAKVDTTDYNFLIEPHICYNEVLEIDYIWNPDQGWYDLYTYVVYEPYDCGQSGIYDALPSAPYSGSTADLSVDVAVVDTGVEDTHPYVTNAIWNNPESNDGDNCKLNDQIGYDFFNDDGIPDDIDGHGTGVNGVIASKYPNDSQLNLMNLKFFENDRSTLFDAVCSIYYAIDNGADVINLSWGLIVHDGLPEILKDVLDYAGTKDVLIINSAGNKGRSTDGYDKWPSGYNQSNSITVAAYERLTTSDDPTLSLYSNYGTATVDLAALGLVETAMVGGGTEILSGTSIAAPLVTRTAAEIRAKYPMLSAAEVKDCILSSVDVFSTLTTRVGTSGIHNHTASLNCAYSTALAKCNSMDVYVVNNHSIDTTILTQTRIYSSIDVNAPLDVAYKAGNFIELNSGFEVNLGAEFLAIIEDCNGYIMAPMNVEGDPVKIMDNSNFKNALLLESKDSFYLRKIEFRDSTGQVLDSKAVNTLLKKGRSVFALPDDFNDEVHEIILKGSNKKVKKFIIKVE